MFCSKCGKEVPDGTKFCSGCGNSLAPKTETPMPETPVAPVPETPAPEVPTPEPEIPVPPIQPVQPVPPVPSVVPETPVVGSAPAATEKSGGFFAKYKVAIIALVAVLALVGTGLAVYFGTDWFKDDEKTASTEKVPEKEVVEPTEPEEPVEKFESDDNDTTITVWSSEAGAQTTFERLVHEWNNEEGREKDIFINWETLTDSTQLDVAMQNDQLPEITNFSSIQLKNAVENGQAIALNDMPGGEEFLEEYGVPGVEGRNMFDGKQYSVYRKTQTAGLIYNKDLFKEAGIVDENGEAKAPTTVAEVREAAKKITALSSDTYGFAFPLQFGLSYTIDSMTANSFYYENPAQKTDLDTLTVTCPGFKDRYQWILDIKNDGSLIPGAETLDNDTARAYFSTGIIGMIPGVSWDVGVYTTQFPAECDWDVAPFPVLDGYEEVIGYQSIGGGMSITNSALVNDDVAKATMEVYKFIYSLETRTALFEDGVEISCKDDVLGEADMDKVDPRWAKFASFVDPNFSGTPQSESYVIEGDSWAVIFHKVWFGDMTLDAAIKDYEARATAGLRKAVQDGTYDVERQKQIDAENQADYDRRLAAIK